MSNPRAFTTVTRPPASGGSAVTLSVALSVGFDVEETDELVVGQRIYIYPKNTPEVTRARQTIVLVITAISGDTVTATVSSFPVGRTIGFGDTVNGYEASVTTTPIIATTAAAVQAAHANGVHIVVPPGLGHIGALTATQSLNGFTGFRLEIGENSWLTSPPNLPAYKAGSSQAPTLSAGTAFAGTVDEFAGAAPLASGSEGLARGDIAAIVRTTNGLVWQLLKVRAVVGSTIGFYSGFVAPFTVDLPIAPFTAGQGWKLHKLTPSCQNIRISGLIKKGTGTAAGANAVSITGGVNIDLSELHTQDFKGHTSDGGVYLDTCYDVRLNNLRSENDGDASTAAIHLLSCNKVFMFAPMIESTGIFPLTMALCTGVNLSFPQAGSGGRSFKLDTCYDVNVFGFASEQTSAGSGTGISIQSGTLPALGSPFAGARLNFYNSQVHFSDTYGIGSDGIGVRDVHLWGGDFRYNNRGGLAKNIVVGNGDEFYIHDVQYDNSIQLGAGSSVYIDNMDAQNVTPTVTQSAGLSAVAATMARYWRRGQRIDFDYVLTVTNGTGAVANNAIEIDLPVPAHADDAAALPIIGSGYIFDSSATLWYPVLVLLTAAGKCRLLPTNIDVATALIYGGQTGGGFAAALAVNDVIKINGRYRAAL